VSNAHLQDMSTIQCIDLAHRRTLLLSSLALPSPSCTLSRSYILVDYDAVRAQARKSGISKVTADRIGVASEKNEKAEGKHCTLASTVIWVLTVDFKRVSRVLVFTQGRSGTWLVF
jgi:hypothetical protein